MKQDKLNIGFITTVSGRWPTELPEKRLIEYREYLRKQYQGLNIISIDLLITNESVIFETIETFRKQAVDLVIMLYGAFTGDNIPTILSEHLNVPIILWAPYEPSFTGGRLMSNALVAATMNNASMRRLDQKVHFVYGSHDDSRAAGELDVLINSYNAAMRIKGSKLGLFGYRPTAFYNSAFDEALIRKTFGLRIESTDLRVVFDKMDQVDTNAVSEDMKYIKATYEIKDLPEEYIQNHSKLYLSLKDIFKKQQYDYAVIKCWPEMGVYHTTPCAVMGRLADEGLMIGCEGDVDVGLAMVIQHVFTDQPTFVTDLINIDEKENILTFWHCGNPAPSLMDPNKSFCMCDHPLAGSGTAFYSTLKPGVVTISRLFNESGSFKLLITTGTAVPMEAYTTGSMVNVKIATNVREYIYSIAEHAIPHHYSIVWKDLKKEMITFCKLLNIEPVII